MPEHFHFQQSEWFLALLPLALLLWLVRQPGAGDSAWRRACDAHLLPHLLTSTAKGREGMSAVLLATAWLIGLIALADPVWEKQPQPVFRTQDARVVVVDLSRSMYTPDLKPSRLARARYKIADILKRTEEGQVGLVAFAGDAFVVSPLTRDADTVAALLKALDPDVMPVQGSRAELGLVKAGELLQQAGIGRGEILLIADGYSGSGTLKRVRMLRDEGYTVSVLGVGTDAGAPLPDGRGGYVHDADGRIVVPQLETDALRTLAETGGGRFALISGDDRDLDWLLTDRLPQLGILAEDAGLETDAWQSRGPWLVLFLLPLAALAFRRGWLVSVFLLLSGVIATPDPALAATWEDLWSRRDQQAAKALEAGDFERATGLAKEPLRRGTAAYRAGQYPQALESFTHAEGPDAAYNRGNALARLGRYEEAITAYAEALSEQPGMVDAEYNKAAVEELLRQQQQSEPNASTPDQKEGTAGETSGQQGEQHAQETDSGSESESRSPSANHRDAPADGQDQQSGTAEEDTQSGAPGGQAGSQQQQAGQGRGNATPGDDEDLASGGQPFAEQHAGDNSQENLDQETRSQGPRENEHAAGQKEPHSQGASAQAEQQAEGGTAPDTQASAAAPSSAETLTAEEKQAAEQWLRRIPDDPGGLLRRKFLYQYRQRAASDGTGTSQAW